jgi:hypothetical protein
MEFLITTPIKSLHDSLDRDLSPPNIFLQSHKEEASERTNRNPYNPHRPLLTSCRSSLTILNLDYMISQANPSK